MIFGQNCRYGRPHVAGVAEAVQHDHGGSSATSADVDRHAVGFEILGPKTSWERSDHADPLMKARLTEVSAIVRAITSADFGKFNADKTEKRGQSDLIWRCSMSFVHGLSLTSPLNLPRDRHSLGALSS